MNRIEWKDADHPRSVPDGSAFAFSRTSSDAPVKVCICGSHMDRAAQIKLRDWLTEQIER